MYSEYLDNVGESLRRLKVSQAEAIRKTATLVADTIMDGGLGYAFSKWTLAMPGT